MRISSVITLLVVLVLFITIETGVIYTKYFASQSIAIPQAHIMGDSISVGTPIGGIVRSIRVWNGQQVRKGQALFTILTQSPSAPFGGAEVTVTALHEGVVSDIAFTEDSFVQAGQVLARIIDVRPESLFVEALLSGIPGQSPAVVPFQRAHVRAAFLNGGDPIAAIITNVDPYDTLSQMFRFRLRMLEPLYITDTNMIVGLPVAVTVTTRESVTTSEFTSHLLASLFSVFAAQ